MINYVVGGDIEMRYITCPRCGKHVQGSTGYNRVTKERWTEEFCTNPKCNWFEKILIPSETPEKGSNSDDNFKNKE